MAMGEEYYREGGAGAGSGELELEGDEAGGCCEG